MRRFSLTIVLACFLTLATEACSPTRAAPTDGTATVVSVTDGDTIDVDIAGHHEAVRFLGIDTPNLAQLLPA